MKKYYKTDEAMVMLRMSKPTILRYMKNGELPHKGPGGRGGYFIKGSDLLLFAQTHAIELKGVNEIDEIEEPNTHKEVSQELALKLEANHILQEKVRLSIELFELEDKKAEVLKAKMALCDLALEEVRLKEAML